MSSLFFSSGILETTSLLFATGLACTSLLLATELICTSLLLSTGLTFVSLLFSTELTFISGTSTSCLITLALDGCPTS